MGTRCCELSAPHGDIEVSIGGFKPPGNDARRSPDPRKPVRILLSILSYRIPSNASRECVATTPPRSKYASFQVYADLFYVRTVTFVQE